MTCLFCQTKIKKGELHYALAAGYCCIPCIDARPDLKQAREDSLKNLGRKQWK
jgi:hypothetical protein